MEYFIIIAILILDQLSKIAVIRYLKPVGEVPLIQNIFHLTYAENRGAAFSILQNQRIFFIILTMLVVGGILVYLHTNKKLDKGLRITLSLVVGGALGNLIDRVRLGYVIDFFDFRIWPIFNIADAAIVIGQLLIVYLIFKQDNPKKER